jgi:hypothetical protein
MSGLVPLAVLALAAAAYPRVRGGGSAVPEYPFSSFARLPSADRPRADCCFALPEQASEEAAPALLVFVHLKHLVDDRDRACIRDRAVVSALATATIACEDGRVGDAQGRPVTLVFAAEPRKRTSRATSSALEVRRCGTTRPTRSKQYPVLRAALKTVGAPSWSAHRRHCRVAYGWLPGPPWLWHDFGRSSFGPVHWPLWPAPLPPLVGGDGLANAAAGADTAKAPAASTARSFLILEVPIRGGSAQLRHPEAVRVLGQRVALTDTTRDPPGRRDPQAGNSPLNRAYGRGLWWVLLRCDGVAIGEARDQRTSHFRLGALESTAQRRVPAPTPPGR